MKNKIISGVLVSALMLSMCPMNVFAETTNTTDTTEQNGSSMEQVTELKDSVIEIKDTTIKATYGESTKTFTYTATMGITPTVSSSDTSVATVSDNNGVVTVTILKAGTSRIEVKFEGDGEYKASSDYIDLIVEKAGTNLSIVPSISDLVGGGEVTLKISGVPEGVTAKVECNYSDIEVVKKDAEYFTVVLPDATKVYKFTLTSEANDNYNLNNTFCSVYVTSLNDSFVEEVTIGEIEVKAAVVNDVVILDTLTVRKLENIVEREEIEGVLSFDFRTAFDEVENIKLDRTTVKTIDSILNDKYFDIDFVEFILDSGKVKFDINAWDEIVDNTGVSGTTISLTTQKLRELNNRQQNALDDYKVYTAVDFRIVGKKSLSELDGVIVISVDYNKNKSYGVYSVTTRGVIEEYKVTIDDDYIVFETDSCLDYAVVQNDSTSNDSSNNTSTDLINGYDKNKVMILTIDSKVMQLYGQTYVNDVAPLIKNSRTMLPIRIIAENLGGHVTWNGELRKVTIQKDNIFIEIFIDSSYAKVNGEVVILDSPAFISNNRTYLPVRFISEKLGATVIWNDYSRDVIISPVK